MTKRHEDYEVEILDGHGKPIAVKRRKDIDKTKDILHVVYIFVVTPEGKLILSRIPRDPTKKNLFAGKLGVTVATIIRHEEKHRDAAKRAAKRELGLKKPDLTFLGETLEIITGVPKRLIAAYVCTASEKDIKPNRELSDELIAVTGKELDRLIEKRKELAPTLLVFWDKYNASIDEL
ncbi:MAG: NUDIX domain-containing protein [Candidatus Uhrbacteria bacterium]|nr:NUDIX domain-containing protein [Candidatus Uhrbacteria bacterium]